MLPSPSVNQPYCNISALEAGLIDLPDEMFITGATKGNVTTAPSLSFLLQHSENHQKFLFDLGIRRDWENYPPPVVEWINQVYHVNVKQDVVESLRKGGTSPQDITNVCLSHCHWDHVGDTTPFTESIFIVRGDSKTLFSPGYPADSKSLFASDLLPLDRTRYLAPADWVPIGPFPRAFDFYGDGSLYIVDAPGHLPGHINILARTSSDGGWIFLAGDSAHHRYLVTGEAEISVGHPGHANHYCAHFDKELAELHIRRIQELMKLPRVRVLLAHDESWYKENEGTSQFWPGKITSM
ncbi:Metallo-hydrolase/oxidoreductase [Cyathus striatus]|nr:Metallo-hydrolase/oxidoreductase [Cyathus striatus]